MPATLADIEKKVRLLTRLPSTAQLSQADLDNYINTFILYDFPEQLRTFNLRKPFSFYTNPGQDVTTLTFWLSQGQPTIFCITFKTYI